jgi:hypothetical protein
MDRQSGIGERAFRRDGISHLFEHMMLKGTQTIGTKNIEEDLKLNLELDRVKSRAAEGGAGAGPKRAWADRRRQGIPKRSWHAAASGRI